MPDDPFDALETVFECLTRMETTLDGMKAMRLYVGKGVTAKMLEALIVEAESQIAEIRRKVTQ